MTMSREPDRPAETGDAGIESSRASVLVVDDMAEMRELIGRALRAEDYDVTLAATLEQARDAEPARYAAILVDARLGRDRGLDLIDALRERDPALVGRCLVLTGGSADGIPADVAVLTKPFQPAELKDAVRSLIRGPRAPAPADPGAAGPPGHAAGPRVPGRRPIPAPGDLSPDVPDPARAVRDGAAPDGAVPDGAAPDGAAPDGAAGRLLDLIRALRACDRRQLAEGLHDGPIQEVSAAILELQMQARSAGPGQRPGYVDEVTNWLTTAVGSLRRLTEPGRLTVPDGHALGDVLSDRAGALLTEPPEVIIDVHGTALSPAERRDVIDVAELMLLAVGADQSSAATIAVSASRHLTIRLELSAMTPEPGGSPADAAAVGAAVGGLARALGGAAETDYADGSWRATITIGRRPGR